MNHLPSLGPAFGDDPELPAQSPLPAQGRGEREIVSHDGRPVRRISGPGVDDLVEIDPRTDIRLVLDAELTPAGLVESLQGAVGADDGHGDGRLVNDGFEKPLGPGETSVPLRQSRLGIDEAGNIPPDQGENQNRRDQNKKPPFDGLKENYTLEVRAEALDDPVRGKNPQHPEGEIDGGDFKRCRMIHGLFPLGRSVVGGGSVKAVSGGVRGVVPPVSA